ncbi:phosphodiester glycosidase family protein [Salinibacterium sp. NSLL150]|uniref:phosphodiester glycosidase family protein n=1 Tax=unclassified Salinibacterium TaxID=2632331 RepID=UPI0018CFB6BD|nr:MULTISPECIES: phosphodiester glycosidase family protein [unclassified Salinibacterium]MBH0098769.1 phosphodiester glycosidase family protein [Salinibacterium sp. NSLL35]MBH0101524.1 phosphodiester glycosidase family protein [Salinibacterium sp. NSLL150]MBH0104283.1 phosphodiester glycosidase family protein [Salinibacterium sp. NSLL16]MBH0107044.1 phosphodiester glycosidase family protein [Salinibacterium sp. NSLL17]
MQKKPLRKRHIVIGSVLVLVLGLGSTAAWALDRFVIEHVEISDVAQYEADNSTTTSAEPTTTTSTEPVLTETSYTSDDANVTISTVVSGSGADTVTYYVADVELTDATTLRSAFAQNSFGENIIDLTSSIAAEHDAIFAINGDYYGFRDTGIVIRNGVTYRDEPARDGLAFYLDGSVEVYDETTTSADELIADGVWNTLSFGPAIVEDGDVVAGIENVEIDTNFGNHSIQGEQPRTAVGVIDDNHLVFVVVDGRDPGYSAGVTLPDLAVIMQDLGATTAYNLDGGGSSTMYFNGTIINQPSNGGERETSDILYVGAAS